MSYLVIHNVKYRTAPAQHDLLTLQKAALLKQLKIVYWSHFELNIQLGDQLISTELVGQNFPQLTADYIPFFLFNIFRLN